MVTENKLALVLSYIWWVGEANRTDSFKWLLKTITALSSGSHSLCRVLNALDCRVQDIANTLKCDCMFITLPSAL